jgi:hypothetical protein
VSRWHLPPTAGAFSLPALLPWLGAERFRPRAVTPGRADGPMWLQANGGSAPEVKNRLVAKSACEAWPQAHHYLAVTRMGLGKGWEGMELPNLWGCFFFCEISLEIEVPERNHIY